MTAEISSIEIVVMRSDQTCDKGTRDGGCEKEDDY